MKKQLFLSLIVAYCLTLNADENYQNTEALRKMNIVLDSMGVPNPDNLTEQELAELKLELDKKTPSNLEELDAVLDGMGIPNPDNLNEQELAELKLELDKKIDTWYQECSNK